MGQPVVQIAFEAKGDTWTLRKRFSGTTGQVSAPGGEQWHTARWPSCGGGAG